MKKVVLTLCLGFLSLFASNLMAQRKCGAETVLQQMMQNDEQFRQTREAIEEHARQFVQNGGTADRAVVTIPVVFHVIYNTATQNISEAQINSQLAILNADFRRLNADAPNTPSVWQGIAADCEINFCLATQDPSGVATTGIQRRSTTSTSFSTNDNMKFFSSGGLDAWDASRYLNFWVCNLSGGILGYAQFPGGTLSTDGVVCTYTAVGNTGTASAPFNLGRTATHEVGDWLNCFHIWGDDGTSCTGTDNCSDTPNQADEHYNCPTFPQVSCSNGPNGDMFMNYMDYTDDVCMNLFTVGQKARMTSLFATGGFRNGLTTSTGCQPANGNTCGVPANPNTTAVTQTAATCNWSATANAVSYTFEWKLASASTYTVVSGLTGTSQNLTGLTLNTAYNWRVTAVCAAATGNATAVQTFTTASNCVEQFEPNNTRNTAYTGTPVGTAFTAKINTSTDKDWYKFANTSAMRRIKVELTNLPADYDLKLYRSSTNVATSQNAGTTAEIIIYNTTTVSTSYYAYVYGYNSAFSNSQCYTLKVSLSATNFRENGDSDEFTEIEIPAKWVDVGFGMFPNPADDILTLDIPVSETPETHITVISTTGQAVVQKSVQLDKSAPQVELNIANLPAGVYFVQVRNGEQSATRKLVVE